MPFGIATATARGEATRLAKRVATLDDELKDITKRITELVRQSPAGQLLDQPGIGPVTAAVALAAWSHLGRVRSEAAFASQSMTPSAVRVKMFAIAYAPCGSTPMTMVLSSA